MVIQISTFDFTGLLADVIPFSYPEDDLPTLHCVRLEWDGSMLHALATDLNRIAISSWHPHDDTEAGDDRDQGRLPVDPWGGKDRPWAVVLPRPDAEKLVQVFKLPTKRGLTPLAIECDHGHLKVVRPRIGGMLALRADVEGSLEEFPDLRRQLSEHDRVEAVGEISYAGANLADFCSAVRQRGPLELGFSGRTGMTRIAIGERFVGAVRPASVRMPMGSRSDTGAAF
ncbi:hypothetical protein [Micromonospora sp. RV43]|uniref:hypothetical protein n=1 Tax=Micromonospora sp. RV43 TaxID=1661387 RepID=UPI00064C0B77|nr:hypothetical protein [Micromonospora sp. RV43]